ncbi:MAG: hypothetical protein WCO84_05700 [bacterium]
MTEIRCLYCGTVYIPYGRQLKRQKVCGAAECVAKHKRALARRWWAARPERRQALNKKKRIWANKRDYWREYRMKNPDYVTQNRIKSRIRIKERRALISMLRRPVAYLDGLKALGGQMFANQDLLAENHDVEPSAPRMFANQDLLNERLDGTLLYLKAQALFANFKDIDGVGVGGVK